MKRYFLITALVGLALSSCQKKNNLEDIAESYDAAKAEFFYNDVNNISDEACNTGDLVTIKSMNGITSGCATISLDTISMPHVATIDFGTSNCLCTDGKNRRGIINISFNGRYRDAGTTITITPNNYFVNDNQVIGTHTVVNQGLNAAGHIYYSVNVNGQVILANGAGTIYWTSSREREWVAGSNTFSFSDDIYSITGSGTGISSNGHTITVTIINPLVRKLEAGCRMHFISGTVDIQPQGKPVITIDFGNGDCDNEATVTFNGNTYNIHLWG
jgi:hypothetical protein